MGKGLEFCVQPRLKVDIYDRGRGKDKIGVKLKKIISNVKNR